MDGQIDGQMNRCKQIIYGQMTNDTWLIDIQMVDIDDRQLTQRQIDNRL